MSTSGLRLDLHNHTTFSADGVMTPVVLLETAKARGIGCIAVTDHNTVSGALEAMALAEADASLPRVIPGTEVFTADGEIIALYVYEDIPSGLPLAETAARVRNRGGIVYLPHPYDLFRRGAISRRERVHAAELSDIIEVVNGRSLGPIAAYKAAKLAGSLGKPRGAGSDAHRKAEVGLASVVVNAYPTRETLVSLVAAGSLRHILGLRQYALNWGTQGLAPVIRMRRRIVGLQGR